MKTKKQNKVPKTPLALLLDNDFHYEIEYSYDQTTHCEEYGCDSEGICRCSTMDDFDIKSVKFNKIAKMFTNLALDEITKYCIHRALVLCKLWSPKSWNWSISHSYYGEELDYIKINDDVRKELDILIPQLLNVNYSNKEKLFIVLEEEYGYILPKLEEFDDFEVIKPSISDIHSDRGDSYQKIDRDVIKFYDGYDLPIGVGIKKSGGVQLIDGHHRFTAKKLEAKGVFDIPIEIIVGK